MKIPCLTFLVFVQLIFSCNNSSDSFNNLTSDYLQDSLALLRDEQPPYPGFLKTYEGRIGDGPDIEMVLTNWGDGFLSGYYFEKKSKNKTEVSGELIDGGKFQLIAGDFNKETGIFSGSLHDPTTIQGTWSDPAFTRTQPFSLQEFSPVEDTTGWAGSWYLNEIWDNGSLFIGNVNYTSFEFALTIARSGHSGTIEGKAIIQGKQAAFQLKDFDTKPCILKFTHRGSHIQVDQPSSNISCGFGARAYAHGQYNKKFVRKKAQLRIGPSEEDVFPDQVTHDSFKSVVGEAAYAIFAYNMLQSDKSRSYQSGIDESTIIAGFVPGFYGINEAIIIFDPTQRYWAATIDVDHKNEYVVRYFTNDETSKEKLPAAIENWRESFKNFRVIYSSFRPAG